MTFAEILDLLRDGKPRRFTNPRLNGYFYKARSPARAIDTDLDGAVSSITYYDHGAIKSSPTLALDDFECADWTAELAWHHPLEKRS